MPRHSGIALFVLASGMLLAACGGGSSAPSQEQQAAERERRAAARAQRAAAACERQIGPLLTSLGELGSRLDVGMNYDDYTTAVADGKVVYDRIPFGQLNDPRCLTDVGLPAEQAFQQYVEAAQAWGTCFEDIECSNDEVRPALQRRWTRADRLVSRAQRALERMKRPE